MSMLPDPMKPFTGFLRPIVLEKKRTDGVEGAATFLARRRGRRGAKFMYVIFVPERIARLDFNRLRNACQFTAFHEISRRPRRNVFAVARCGDK